MPATHWSGPIALVFVLLCSTSLARAQTRPNVLPQEQLWDAAMVGDTLTMGRALAAGAAIDSLDTRRSENGRRALNWAALNDKADAIRFLVAHGAAVNIANLTGFTPLHHAAESGSLNAAKALLDAGADPTWPNNMGETPLDVAVRTSHLEVAAVLRAATGISD
jgi:uncharacterized protein